MILFSIFRPPFAHTNILFNNVVSFSRKLVVPYKLSQDKLSLHLFILSLLLGPWLNLPNIILRQMFLMGYVSIACAMPKIVSPPPMPNTLLRLAWGALCLDMGNTIVLGAFTQTSRARSSWHISCSTTISDCLMEVIDQKVFALPMLIFLILHKKLSFASGEKERCLTKYTCSVCLRIFPDSR